MLIYKITNVVNRKTYVGATKNTLSGRWKAHIDKARYGRKWKSHLHLDILEYGTRSFSIELIQECSYEESEKVERQWMERLNSYHPNGYNIRSGGIHSPQSELTKQKLRGRVFTPEHRANISRAMTGRKNPSALKTIIFAQKARWKNGKPIGENNPNARLTAELVREIRRRYKVESISQEGLAAEYGIKQITVSAIVRRKIWRSIPEEY